MDLNQLFLERYNPLYQFWLAGTWETVPSELMRQRPHPRVNSIAWNLWHLTRVEDVGINRYVVDRPQVFDEGEWMQKMNIPWRHQGTDMNFDEVDELNQRIDLQALRAYSKAVEVRSREIVSQLSYEDLSGVLDEARLRVIFLEGIAHPKATGLLENYLGWTKGKCLTNFCMTHPYQHVGEIGVIASLLGVDFD